MEPAAQDHFVGKFTTAAGVSSYYSRNIYLVMLQFI